MFSRLSLRLLSGALLLLAASMPLHAQTPAVGFCDAPTVVPNHTVLPDYSPLLCFQYSGLQTGAYRIQVHLLQWKEPPGMPPCGSNQWCGPASEPDAVFPIDNSSGNNSSGIIRVVRSMEVSKIDATYSSFMWVIDLFNQSQPNLIMTSATQPASSTANRAPVLGFIGDRTATTGVPLQFTISASDTEGDAVALSVQNLPPGATFDPSNGQFNWPSPVAGTYSSIVFKATQTGPTPLSDAEIINIQVDPPTQVLAFSAGAYAAGEAGPAVITVNRTGGSTGTVSIQYTTAAITAGAGIDYTTTSGTLQFAPGQTSRVFSVPIVNDTGPESSETFRVTLSAPVGALTGAASTATVMIFDDDTTSSSGQWGPVVNWPVVPIHMHLLPTGKVLIWDRHKEPNDPNNPSEPGVHWDGEPRLWDPTTQAFSTLPLPGYDLFCGGHAFLADGRLLVSGGHIPRPPPMDGGVGEDKASIYDPFNNSWTRAPNMNAGRWYPTNTTLANGDMLVLAGTTTGYENVNPLPQVWQAANGTWRNLTTALQGNFPAWADFYPFLYLAPNGKVFNAGPQQTSRYLDTSGTGAWTDVAAGSLSYRDYGSSVMYDDGKVLVVGGNPRESGQNVTPTILPSATAEVIDLGQLNPVWRVVSPMSAGRRHLNTTLLPDGNVLVTGGSSFAGFDEALGKVLYAEMWNPSTEAWTIMAGHTRYRGYHSNALLLPDGRVLIAGGGHPNPSSGAEQNAEIYSPPYLFKGARPAITAAPAQVGYGQTFMIETPTPQSITKVNWIRLPSVTHAFNQNQRINRLSFSQTAGGLLVTAPSSANLCPPGHYMLFILNGDGVPSVARIIRIGTGNTAPVIQFDSSTYSTTEGAGVANITVTRSGDLGTSVSVGYATGNGTATAGEDYTPASGTLTFNAGEVSVSFNVSIREDTLYETSETINLTLSNPVGGATLGASSTAVLTVADNDPQPTLSIGNASIQEGNSGAANLSFTVNLSAAGGLNTTVHYATADGTATVADNDYAAINDTVLTIPAGSTGANITVTVNGDTKVEANETFLVNLSNAVNATIAAGQATGTINNDDAAMTLQLSAASYSTGEDSQSLNITVTRTGNISGPASVKYSTGDATDANFRCDPATSGQPTGIASRKCDYHIAAGILRFAAGEDSKQFTLSFVNDVYVEGNESFNLKLSNPIGGTLGQNNNVTVTIIDDDTAGAANPIDNTRFFVRQLYVDLLSREPDPAGWNGWTTRIDQCGQPGQPPPPCDRVTVGGDGFLRSGEFFDRQFFVLRLYRTGLGRILRYDDVGDLAFVSGFLTAEQLELNKQDLVAEIMSRGEFAGRYNGLGNTQFVDTLLQTAAVSVPQSIRDGWVSALDRASKTRSQVYREISERSEVSNKYLHEAQVVSCYYGFFTRNPDGAYLNYLQRLDSGEITLGDLANAFINAAEYRQRFGQ
jgi:Domain of unknown function (DUF1929)/Calx-beta domain